MRIIQLSELTEVHVRLNEREVLIRPIAGTRPRGQNDAEDRELEEDLLADEKEKAEHLMLVDLARNDIGRVCKSGTIRAAEYMNIERYSHVMHIVSQVIGELSDDKNAFDLLRATFPAGTVSEHPRFAQCKLYLNLRKHVEMHMQVLWVILDLREITILAVIRTAIIQDNLINLQAGAGIVVDSQPEMELRQLTKQKVCFMF